MGVVIKIRTKYEAEKAARRKERHARMAEDLDRMFPKQRMDKTGILKVYE